MTRQWALKTEDEVLELGKRLGLLLKADTFVALYGDLGAGKTVFARGIGTAVGAQRINSPTFTIVRQYQTLPPLYHFDAYRLSNSDELYAMGYSDYVGGIVLMEWANLVEDTLPRERLDVFIVGNGELPRTITIVSHGQSYDAILEEL